MTNHKKNEKWSEADSRTFVDRGAIFVPARDEQIDTLRSLIPAKADEPFKVVELGAGEGVLARSVLAAFPHCHYVAFDGSKVMRSRLGRTLAAFKNRVEIRDFELADRKWCATLPRPLRCVLASLVVHHLPGSGKKRLFADIARRLERGGALLLADIVEAPDERVAKLFARQWDDAVRAQSLEKTGGLGAFKFFDDEGWNFYSDEEPDPYDQPSRLFDQLKWLREVGLSRVDCFWMRAGHAIYGGYR